ncbi:MAG: ATP-dependent DNA helicase RecG [Balneolaceae bacterium]|nr:MAG: ATP-dependent DNA helicase RecG [Balneolaceae bacterium]
MNLTDLHNLSLKRAAALSKTGINTISDLLYFFPRRYIDKRGIWPIGNLHMAHEAVTVIGKIISVNVIGSGTKKRLEVVIQDHTASVKAVYFKGWKYHISRFKTGELISLYGTPRQFGRYFSMAHPEAEPLTGSENPAGNDTLIPIYPSNKHFAKAFISNKLLADWIRELLNSFRAEEYLPGSLLQKYSLPDLGTALQNIHFPSSSGKANEALNRFKFEELFLFELCMSRIKHERHQRKRGAVIEPGALTHLFFNKLLPFKLTEGQKQALGEIRKDLRSQTQMNRLLQGDVGAGKTVVALGAILMAIDSGKQAAMMAPTEILAEQHYHTLNKYLSGRNIEYRLLTGGQRTALRRDILTSVESGSCSIVIGTHAIIQDQVQFHNLGLVVIDEQHRFGVKQRNEILLKGDNPHLLVMSATPIPRSLAMTIYSDLDISVIRELPAGRKEIKTAVRTDRDRESVYRFIEHSVKNGEQVYVIFPLIEESEVMDLKDATMGFEKLKRRFPSVSIRLLHGRMTSDEKEEVMKAFVDGRVSVLVSTTVVEVGVDVPNASIMVIEHAERFGLSQLHQLRGRIGRGSRQSYCILMPGEKISHPGRIRLKKLVETTDGFEIAEADLRLRGPGDFLGTKQSGLPEFKYADIIDDRLILEQAKNEAWRLFTSDSDLSSPENQKLAERFHSYFRERAEFFGTG